MKVLAIDTSGPVCGVAVLTDEGIRYSCAVQNKRTHSVNLMPMIDAALRATGLTLADMDRLACTVGPGSFTGVRLSSVNRGTPSSRIMSAMSTQGENTRSHQVSSRSFIMLYRIFMPRWLIPTS